MRGLTYYLSVSRRWTRGYVIGCFSDEELLPLALCVCVCVTLFLTLSHTLSFSLSLSLVLCHFRLLFSCLDAV